MREQTCLPPPALMQSRVSQNLPWHFSYSPICTKTKSANCSPTHMSDVQHFPRKKLNNLTTSFTGLFHSSNEKLKKIASQPDRSERAKKYAFVRCHVELLLPDGEML